jgi:SHS2 domain-containing protein
MTPPRWERFSVEPDVGLRGWARSRGEAFAQVTLGMFALLVAPEQIRAVEQREVRAQAATPDRLLAAWIDECVYVHEIEGFVVRAVEMTVCSDTLAHGVLHGEPLDPARHRLTVGVKGAVPQEARVEVHDAVHEARIVVRVQPGPVS